MKKFLVFILILLSKIAFSCGFYPFGEDVRMSFFEPENFSYLKFSQFNYDSNYFEPKEIYGKEESFPNDFLWKKYCENQVSEKDIAKVMREFSYEEINEKSENSFLKYLYKNKDLEAINYLRFAKSCENFNNLMEDPWEKNEVFVSPKRKVLVQKAIELSKNSKNKEISKRYAFLAMRLAFYNHDFEKINKVYADNFENLDSKNLVDYLAMSFKGIAEKNKAKANYYFAQVFANVPEKRFLMYQNFNSQTPIENVLKFAKNNDEKAFIYELYGTDKSDKNLEYLQKIYELKPNFDGLSFLLLREINKTEDWILTPYYTLFEPSIQSNIFNEDYEKTTTKIVFDRIVEDRVYAQKVLDFVNSVDLKSVENPIFWLTAKAHLQFLVKDYSGSLATIDFIQKRTKNKEILQQISTTKTLDLFANQSFGNAKIPDETRVFILNNKENKRFLFALGRELEFLGNTTDAGLLYSKCNSSKYDEAKFSNNPPYWKTINENANIFEDYFYDDFQYIDAVYTPQQVENLVANVNANKEKSDDFSKWIYSDISKKANQLQELIGTKYLRENNLDLAILNYKKLGNYYFEVENSTWERNNVSEYLILDRNPFYTLNYTPDFIEDKEPFRLNKLSVVQKLKEYLKKAENPNEKRRDYYYFLVANCYYNMTEFGNSWMMKRNYLGGENQSIIEDNEEFNCGNLAKKYYILAKENANSEKMLALCLRMAGKCEKFRQYYQQELSGNYYDRFYEENNDESLLSKNPYYQELKKDFPKDYEDLMSNCESFKNYFVER